MPANNDFIFGIPLPSASGIFNVIHTAIAAHAKEINKQKIKSLIDLEF